MISKYESGDATEIWEAIFSGAKVEVAFSSAEEAEKCRVRLYQIKKAKETKYLGIGMMNEEEVQSLIWEPQLMALNFLVYLGKRKREAKQYKFRILDGDPNSGS